MKFNKTPLLIFIAFLTSGITLLFFYFLTYQNMKSTLSTGEEERITLKLMLHLANVENCLVDIGISESAVVTQQQQFLQKFKDASDSCKKEIASLYAIGNRNQIPLKDIGVLDSIVQERISFAQHLINLSLQGKNDEAMHLFKTAKGVNLRIAARKQIISMENEGTAKLHRYEEKHNFDAQHTYQLFGFMGLIAFVFITYAFFKILQDHNLKSKLAKQNEFLAEVVNKTSDAVVTFNQFHIVTYWNKAAEKMYGKKAEDVLGRKNSFVFGVRSNLYKAKIIAEQLKKRGHWSGELKDTDANGNPMDVLASITILKHEAGKIVKYISINIDITEQKKATKKIAELAGELKTLNDSLQEKVAEQTAKLTALIEHTPAYLCEINREGLILSLNKSYGTDTKKEDIIGTLLYKWAVNEEQRNKIKSIIDHVFITNQSYYYEYNYSDPQNKIHYYSSSFIPVMINSKTESIIFTAYDITEQKKTEEEAKKLASIMDHSEMLVGIMTMDFKIDYLNSATKKRIGINEDEDIKMLDAVDFFSTDKKFDEQIMAELFTTGKWIGENIALSKTKEIIPVMQVLMLHKDESGKPIFISSTAIDISELKQKEQELKNLTSIIENSPAYITMSDMNKNYLYANTAFREAFGIDKNEDITALNVAAIRGPSSIEIIKNGSEENLTNGKWTGTNTFISRSGKEIHVLQVLVLHKNDKDEPIRISFTAIDLSAQKKIEKELKKTNADLTQLSRHLQKIREEERKEIAREIHDEFGQNFTVLKMNAVWLKKHMVDETNKNKVLEKLNELMEIADLTIHTSRRLYNSLHPSVIDDIGVIAAIEGQARTFTKSTGIIVEFLSNIHDEKFSQNISIGLYRVCQESLTNVLLHAKATKVIIDITKKDGTIILCIEDNGEGFDVSKVNTNKKNGLLGMRERIYAMNGILDIDSTKNKGTKVCVTVPVI